MKSIEIRQPNDFHHHLRDGDMLNITAKECFDRFNNVIVMPNLIPPITTIQQAINYRSRIKNINIKGNPMMTLYLNKNIKEKDLRDFKNYDFMTAIKYYPKSATTNSEFGISNISEIYDILKIMEEEDIPLLIHGESIKEGVDIFHREKVFLKEELTGITENFPKLRIVLEHITTKEAVDFVLKYNIHATITPHHLLLDRNDIFKNGINPHLYCLPILKKKVDREALVNAATSGKSNFFLGTDSAPHLKHNKLSCCGCAGIFNTTVAIEVITEIFEKSNMLDKLEQFVSLNGSDFYKLKYNDKIIKIVEEEWEVPEQYGEIVPLYCGKKLKWKYLY
tara:strand:+ start:138 stop:1145 length:1008 start_codon:yes stop_codon:yes gene_type:complete